MGAFFDGKRLAKVSVDGGTVVPLADFDVMAGGSWSEDGNLIFGSGVPHSAGLMRIASVGGTPSPVLKLASGEFFHAWPQILPGGKAVLMSAVGDPPSIENFKINIVSIDDGRRKTLARGGVTPRYVPSGHLLYVNKATMFAIPFDIEKAETRGTAVPVLDDVAYDSVANGAQFDVSRTGTLVYRRSSGDAASSMMRVQWLDAASKQEPLLGNPRIYVGTPRLSPDGRRVAITIRDGANQDVWVYDQLRDAMTRLTHGGGIFTNPIWSKDGRHVVFTSMGSGVFWIRADGSGQPQALLSNKTTLQFPSSFTPDGKRLAYFQVDGHPQIWSVDVENDAGVLKAGKPVRFLTTQYQDMDPVFSPDGRWIAYSSNESGKLEVYVRAFSVSPAGSEGKWQISNSGGTFPGWSPNRRELLYRNGAQIMTVGYTASGDSFVAEKPRVWAANVASATGFDFAPDGKRMVITLPATTTAAPTQEHTIVFVQNFFDELRRLAPVGP